MKGTFSILLSVMLSTVSVGLSPPAIRTVDKLRIAEAIAISRQYGEQIWPGFNQVPFRTLLIADSIEFLLYHDHPSNDFQILGFDTLLQTTVYYRSRTFSPQLAATFPAVGGQSTIVIGIPENSGHSSTGWIMTYLHEHFHQYTYDSPDYYSGVNALDLAGDDQSGMWMLNYPFPYEDKQVISFFNGYRDALKQLVSHNFSEKEYELYQQRRAQLKQQLSEKDYAYLSFQLWQEGIARYTEYKFLQLLGLYQGSAGVQALPDFVPFNALRDQMYQELKENLNSQQLQHEKRICFYTAGFAEGLLLDHLNPDWRHRYLVDKFFLEKMVE